jgi:hypothetical protein
MKEYAYKNVDDSKRFKVFHREEGGGWDVDVWNDLEDVSTFSSETGEIFDTKADALAWIRSTYGVIRLLPAGWSNIREGWKK